MKNLVRVVLQWAFMFMVCMMCMAVINPVGAQDATPETAPVARMDVGVDSAAPSNGTLDATALFQTALIVIGAVVTIAFAVFGYIVRPAIVGAVVGMPEWGANMLFSAGDAGLDALEGYAKGTPGETDDSEVAKLRREFEELRRQIEERRTPQLE